MKILFFFPSIQKSLFKILNVILTLNLFLEDLLAVFVFLSSEKTNVLSQSTNSIYDHLAELGKQNGSQGLLICYVHQKVFGTRYMPLIHK